MTFCNKVAVIHGGLDEAAGIDHCVEIEGG
jgi:hypothetical protein